MYTNSMTDYLLYAFVSKLHVDIHTDLCKPVYCRITFSSICENECAYFSRSLSLSLTLDCTGVYIRIYVSGHILLIVQKKRVK